MTESANPFSAADLVAQVADLLGPVLQIVAEAIGLVLELLLQRGLHERRATQEPDREREEDRDDRHDVVPERDHSSSFRSNSHWRNCSNSCETYSRSGGETTTTAATATSAAATRRNASRRPDPRRVDARDALRVHQDLAHAEPDQEGARHPLAALVEELAEVAVAAHGHDRLGALLVGEQERGVLARAGGLDHAERHAERLEPLATRRVAVPVGVQHELGRPAPAEPPAARGTRERERLVRDAVHVAEDQVGRVARPRSGRRRRRRPRAAPGGRRGCTGEGPRGPPCSCSRGPRPGPGGSRGRGRAGAGRSRRTAGPVRAACSRPCCARTTRSGPRAGAAPPPSTPGSWPCSGGSPPPPGGRRRRPGPRPGGARHPRAPSAGAAGRPCRSAGCPPRAGGSDRGWGSGR